MNSNRIRSSVRGKSGPIRRTYTAAVKAIIIIPARYGSKRFAGKPLAVIRGEPMIVHVLRRAEKIRNADVVIVATDDPRIRAIVEDAGGTAIMTSSEHPTGTSRVREAAAKFTHGIVVNVQGDEPLLPVQAVERLIDDMRADPSLMMATLATPIDDSDEFRRPDVVKVVCDRDGNALYFSRAPIPFPGFPPEDPASRPQGVSAAGRHLLRHIGVYAFRRELLMLWRRLAPGPLERFESLEQLRALENGYRIRVVTCRSDAIGVDRPEDLKKVEQVLKTRPSARRSR
jgi:3-deoxy-manno-octulosonate cytidylyltransferase (CMP-KDO synthetase)